MSSEAEETACMPGLYRRLWIPFLQQVQGQEQYTSVPQADPDARDEAPARVETPTVPTVPMGQSKTVVEQLAWIQLQPHRVTTTQVRHHMAAKDATLWQRYLMGEYTIVPEQNNLMDAWDALVILSLLYTASILPYGEAFYVRSPDWLTRANTVVDCIFVADILVTFQVAYTVQHALRNDLYEREPVKIARHYMGVPFIGVPTAGWFWLDVLTVIPWGTLGSTNIRLLRVLRLLRMVRLVRVIKLCSRWHARIGISYAFLNIAKCAGVTFAVLHWMTCMWGFFGMQARREDAPSWLLGYSERPAVHEDIFLLGRLEVYNLAMYFCVMTLTSVGFGDITPIGQAEVTLCCLTMWASSFMWAWVLANMVNIVENAGKYSTYFQQLNDDMNELMEARLLPHTLKMRARKHLAEAFKVHRQRYQQATIRSLSVGLQGEIALQSGAASVCDCIWFLRDLNLDVLTELVAHLVPEMYSPAEYIIHKYAVSVIRRGACWWKTRILTRDDVIGQDMILDTEHLRESVHPKTLNYVEVMTLNRTDLAHVCEMYPDFSKKVRIAQIRMAVCRAVVYYAKRAARAREMGDGRARIEDVKSLAEFPDIRFCKERDRIAEIISLCRKIQQGVFQVADEVGAVVSASTSPCDRSPHLTRSDSVWMSSPTVGEFGRDGSEDELKNQMKRIEASQQELQATLGVLLNKLDQPRSSVAEGADVAGGPRTPSKATDDVVVERLMARFDTLAAAMHERHDSLEASVSSQGRLLEVLKWPGKEPQSPSFSVPGPFVVERGAEVSAEIIGGRVGVIMNSQNRQAGFDTLAKRLGRHHETLEAALAAQSQQLESLARSMAERPPLAPAEGQAVMPDMDRLETRVAHVVTRCVDEALGKHSAGVADLQVAIETLHHRHEALEVSMASTSQGVHTVVKKLASFGAMTTTTTRPSVLSHGSSSGSTGEFPDALVEVDHAGGSAESPFFPRGAAPESPVARLPLATASGGQLGSGAEALCQRLESLLVEQQRCLDRALASQASRLDRLQASVKVNLASFRSSASEAIERSLATASSLSPSAGLFRSGSSGRLTALSPTSRTDISATQQHQMQMQTEVDQTRLMATIRIRGMSLETALSTQLADLGTGLRERTAAQMEGLRDSMANLVKHQSDALQASLAVQLGGLEAECCRQARERLLTGESSSVRLSPKHLRNVQS